MPFYTFTKIAGLSSFLITIRKLCAIIAKYQSNIRAIVPEEQQATFDTAMLAIIGVCAIVEAAARAQIVPDA